MAAEHDVLADAHVEEDLEVLEGPREAEPREREARPAGDVLVGEPDAAGIGREHAADQVEERGLAGTIGADDRLDAARLERKGEIAHRLDAAEGLRQRLDPQQAHEKRPSRLGTRPRGRKIITSIRTRPKTTCS